MNKHDVIEALDRVIEYLHNEQEDFEDSEPARQWHHIWTAVQVLIRHRAELSGDDGNTA